MNEKEIEYFTKIISGTEFGFQYVLEGKDQACWLTVNGQNYKMTVNAQGDWVILQQVPSWIKSLEKELSDVIEQAYY